MRKNNLGLTGLAAFSLASTSCSSPFGVGKYKFDDRADSVMKNYLMSLYDGDLKNQIERILNITDKDSNGVIDSDEAYESIDMLRSIINPFKEKFKVEVDRLEREYYLKKEQNTK